MPKIKHFIFGAVLVFGSVLLTLLLIEFVFRLTPIAQNSMILTFPRYYWESSERLGYDIAPNRASLRHKFADGEHDIWSNDMGCFDEPFDKKAVNGGQEKKLIYLTGDSFTWGFTDFEHKWGTILEKETGVRVLKCAVDGYGTKQEFLKTENHLKEIPTPNLIVVGYLGANDIEDDLRFPNFTIHSGYRIPSGYIYPGMNQAQKFKVWINTHSTLFNFIKPNIRNVFSKVLPDSILTRYHIIDTGPLKNPRFEETNTVALNAHFENILAFKKLAADKNTQLLFVLIPSKDDLGLNGLQISQSNQKTKEFLIKHKIRFLDLYEPFAAALKDNQNSKPLYWSQDGHWNIEGNQLAGSVVSKYVIEEFGLSKLAGTSN